MNLPADVVDRISPKDCVKPEIRFDNYYLDWNEVSFGIPSKEVSKFRTFLQDVIPMLDMMIGKAKEMQQEGQEKKIMTRHQLGEAFTPIVQLIHDNYRILVAWDKQIFVDRIEDINIINDSGVVRDRVWTSTNSSLLDLEWNLGQLVPIE